MSAGVLRDFLAPAGLEEVPCPLFSSHVLTTFVLISLRILKAQRAEQLASARTPRRRRRRAKPAIWKKWYFWVAAAVLAGVVAAFAVRDSMTEETVILRVTRP